MALITCPECNRQINDRATTCPHCGYPMQDDSSRGTTTGEEAQVADKRASPALNNTGSFARIAMKWGRCLPRNFAVSLNKVW